jgi:hypothetical protein
MANYAEFRGPLETLIALSKEQNRLLRCISCGGEAGITTSGVGTDVPAGMRSVSIVKTSEAGTVNITMSDGSIYPMTQEGEVFVTSAGAGGVLPDYLVATADAATWKWHGIK